MGADLILAWCPMPRYLNGDDVENLSDIEPQIRNRLETETARSALTTYREFLDPEDPQDEVAMDAVRTVFTAMDSWRRDATVIPIDKDKTLYVVGGTSWGDTPSDIYDEVIFVNDSEVFERPFAPPTEGTRP